MIKKLYLQCVHANISIKMMPQPALFFNIKTMFCNRWCDYISKIL